MSEQQSAPAAPQAAPAAGIPGQSAAEGNSSSQEAQDISPADLEALAGEGGAEGGSAQEAKSALTEAEQNLKNAKNEKEKAQAKKELEKAKHVYKLKVDGEEFEWEGTEDDVKRELQLAKKARKEIQGSASLKKEVAEFLHALKTDPKKVLSDPSIGVDVLEMAKSIINEQIENEMKSPEQLAKEKLEKEVEELRRHMKDENDKRQKNEYERMVKQHETDLEDKMMQALDTSGLPASPYILKRAADVMLSGLENGKDLSPKQAINIVKREMQKDIKDLFTVSPDELLEELLGSDNIKRINKRQLSKIRKSVETASSVKESGNAPSKEERSKQQPSKKMTISEWLRNK